MKCKHCGTEIYYDPQFGWIAACFGDPNCGGNGIQAHEPTDNTATFVPSANIKCRHCPFDERSAVHHNYDFASTKAHPFDPTGDTVVPPVHTLGYLREVTGDLDGPSCHVCGAIMVEVSKEHSSRLKWKCLSCGTTTGCEPSAETKEPQ